MKRLFAVVLAVACVASSTSAFAREAWGTSAAVVAAMGSILLFFEFRAADACI